MAEISRLFKYGFCFLHKLSVEGIWRKEFEQCVEKENLDWQKWWSGHDAYIITYIWYFQYYMLDAINTFSALQIDVKVRLWRLWIIIGFAIHICSILSRFASRLALIFRNELETLLITIIIFIKVNVNGIVVSPACCVTLSRLWSSCLVYLW